MKSRQHLRGGVIFIPTLPLSSMFGLLIPLTSESFMENATKFSEEAFVPNVTDIVHCREVTKGVKETIVTSPDGREVIIRNMFGLTDLQTIFIDVGGQKSERRKWLHIFDNCTAIIYVAALNGCMYHYRLVIHTDLDCQVLEEDDTTNRLLDSLQCLGEVSGNDSLNNIPFLIFLNKYDLFSQRIEEIPLTQCFPHYEGMMELRLI